VKRPTILVGLGSGREAWLSVELDSLRFVLDIENGKRSPEILSLSELKTRFPHATGLMADVVAEAIRAK
jgi:hypothetical protein